MPVMSCVSHGLGLLFIQPFMVSLDTDFNLTATEYLDEFTAGDASAKDFF